MTIPIILRFSRSQPNMPAWVCRVSESLPSAATKGPATGALRLVKRDSRSSMAARKIIWTLSSSNKHQTTIKICKWSQTYGQLVLQVLLQWLPVVVEPPLVPQWHWHKIHQTAHSLWRWILTWETLNKSRHSKELMGIPQCSDMKTLSTDRRSLLVEPYLAKTNLA